MEADDEVILEVTWETSSKVFARLKVPPAATLRNIHDALVSKRGKLDETEFVYLFHGKPVFREFWEVFTADNFDGSLIMRKGVIVLGLDGSQITEDEWNAGAAKTPRMTISQVKAPPKLPDEVKPKEIPPSPVAEKEKEKGAPISPYSGGVLPSKPAPSVFDAISRKEKEREENIKKAKKSAADSSPVVPDLKKFDEAKKAAAAKKPAAGIKIMDIDVDDGEITDEEVDLPADVPPEVKEIVDGVGAPVSYAPPKRGGGPGVGGIQLPGMGASGGPPTPKKARESKKPESAFAPAPGGPTTPKYPTGPSSLSPAPAPATKPAPPPAVTSPPAGPGDGDEGPVVSDTGSTGTPTTPAAKKVQALYNYKARSADQLSFSKGDQMEILIFRPKGKWWFAKLNEKKGWIPYNFVQVLE